MSLTTLIILCVWITGFFGLLLVKPAGVRASFVELMFFIWPIAVVFAGISLILERGERR